MFTACLYILCFYFFVECYCRAHNAGWLLSTGNINHDIFFDIFKALKSKEIHKGIGKLIKTLKVQSLKINKLLRFEVINTIYKGYV